MAKREYNGDPIDLTGARPVWTARNDDAGKTVGGTTADDEGTMQTDFWPSDAADKSELSQDQIKVIEAAANPAKEFDSIKEISKEAAPDKSSSYANYVLREYWPRGHAENKSPDGNAAQDNGETGENDSSTMQTDFWPSNAPPRRELNEDQIKVIEAAANPAKEFGSLSALSRSVTPERSRTYASNVLRDQWPEAVEKIKDSEAAADAADANAGDAETPLTQRADEIRQRLLEGESVENVADALGGSHAHIRKIARGQRGSSDAATTPPVTWDKDVKEWRPIDSGDRAEGDGETATSRDDEREGDGETPPQTQYHTTPTADEERDSGRLLAALTALFAFVFGWWAGREGQR